nr:MAG TPA: hypothetical protein [Caudoviricetes sp.]
MVDRLDRVAKAKAQLTNKGDYILSAKGQIHDYRHDCGLRRKL